MSRFTWRDSIFYLTDLGRKLDWFQWHKLYLNGQVPEYLSSFLPAVPYLISLHPVDSCSGCMVITNKGLFSTFAFVSKIFTGRSNHRKVTADGVVRVTQLLC